MAFFLCDFEDQTHGFTEMPCHKVPWHIVPADGDKKLTTLPVWPTHLVAVQGKKYCCMACLRMFALEHVVVVACRPDGIYRLLCASCTIRCGGCKRMHYHKDTIVNSHGQHRCHVCTAKETQKQASATAAAASTPAPVAAAKQSPAAPAKSKPKPLVLSALTWILNKNAQPPAKK